MSDSPPLQEAPRVLGRFAMPSRQRLLVRVMVLAYLVLAMLPWLTRRMGAGQSQTTTWKWTFSVAYPVRPHDYLPRTISVPFGDGYLEAGGLETLLWMLGNIALWLTLIVVASYVVEEVRRDWTRVPSRRSQEPAPPESRLPAVLAVGLAVAYAAAALNANPKQPTPFTEFLSRVIYPIQAHGYLPQDMGIAIGPSFGLGARDMEGLLAVLVNVGLWVGVIAAVAILSHAMLDRRKHPR